jgi:Ca-activated chloride channel family protein
LAKRYGITTPYTSYLIVPDAAVPVAGAVPGKPNVAFGPGGNGFGGGGPGPGFVPPALNKGPTSAPVPVADFAKGAKAEEGGLSSKRDGVAKGELDKAQKEGDAKGKYAEALQQAKDRLDAFGKAKEAMKKGEYRETQEGKLGVDLSCESGYLRTQTRLTQTAVRRIGTQTCLEIGGVWIDEGYDAKMKTVTVKAMSAAYFRLLERQPGLRDVFRLGNHLLWVTPSGTALIIDTSTGLEKMSDADIDRLFEPRKK